MSATESVDVLIVGSGPVGSTFARTISDADPSLRILMVEAGPQVSDPPGRHVKTIEDPTLLEAAQIASQGPYQFAYGKPSPLAGTAGAPATLTARAGTFLIGGLEVDPEHDDMPAAAMATNVGGMGAHWTCACPVPGDGERIDFIPREEFDEVFARSWELLHVTQSAFEGAPLGDEVRGVLARAIGDVLKPGRGVQPMPLGVTVKGDSRYWTGPDVILDSIAQRGTFELRPNTLATSVVHADGAVSGARLRDRLTGREYEVAARAVVVAGDSFRTPQLLHASGIRPRALGHYLNDHPQAIGLAQLGEEFLPEEARVARRAGQLDPLSGVSWVPYDRDAFPYHAQVMQLDTSPVPLDGLDEPWPGSIVGVGLFGTKELQFDDRVEFSDTEVDDLGMPALQLHYTLTDRDRATLDGMVATITELATALGGLVGGRAPVILPSGSSLHYMGTVRMGAADDGESVCDTNSAVWGTTNLYVGGNGVIPTPTACNPTATSVALAIRSARHIVSTLTD